MRKYITGALLKPSTILSPHFLEKIQSKLNRLGFPNQNATPDTIEKICPQIPILYFKGNLVNFTGTFTINTTH
ncbi:MAG: hypothetical protein WC742_14175 [Gallionellaceae bacterium]|jgi:hypothetical protein